MNKVDGVATEIGGDVVPVVGVVVVSAGTEFDVDEQLTVNAAANDAAAAIRDTTFVVRVGTFTDAHTP